MPYRLAQACHAGLYVRPRLGYMQPFRPDFSMRFHRHNTVEFMYAVGGMFSCQVLSEDKASVRSVTVRPRGCLAINTAVRHRLVIEQPVQILNLEFEFLPDPFGAYPLDDLAQRSPGFRRLAENDQDVVVFSNCSDVSTVMKLLLDMIVRYPQLTDPGIALLQSLYVGTFFAELTMYYSRGTLTVQQGQYVDAVKEHIEQNYGSALTLQDIADIVNLHPNYVERLFKIAEGCTIIDHLNRYRVLRAAYLLRMTDRAVEDIAYEVGFNSRQHFARIFRRIMGMSAQGYRTLLSLKNYDDDEIDSSVIRDEEQENAPDAAENTDNEKE